MNEKYNKLFAIIQKILKVPEAKLSLVLRSIKIKRHIFGRQFPQILHLICKYIRTFCEKIMYRKSDASSFYGNGIQLDLAHDIRETNP